MSNNELISSLLFKLNENQLAIAAAVEELSNWAETQGARGVAENVGSVLETLDDNLEFITRGIRELRDQSF